MIAFLVLGAGVAKGQTGEKAAVQNPDARSVTLWMDWQRGQNKRYGPNFIYLHTPCENSQSCECSLSFKTTNSQEFADYIQSFGQDKVPAVFDVAYGSDGHATSGHLVSVGVWKKDKFTHNDQLISITANFHGGAVGERQSFKVNSPGDCFPPHK